MAGLSTREYKNLVDENLVLFGGGAPCCNIDPRLWQEFRAAFKTRYPSCNKNHMKPTDWSFDEVNTWFTELSADD